MLAGEIGELYRVYGALRLALTAAHALIVIDDGEIVDDVDRVMLAVAHAEAAADAARGALLSYNSSLLMVGADDDDAPDVREELDEVIRAGLGAKPAADAFTRIDVRYSVLDADGVLRADLRAVSEAEAAEGAHPLAAVKHLRGAAGIDTLVLMLALLIDAISAAMDERDLLDYVFTFDAEDVGDLLGDGVSAGNAKIRLRSFDLRERVRVTVAPGEAAGAAVCAGKALADLYLCLINGNAHEMRSHREHYAADKAYARNGKYGDKNRTHIDLPSFAEQACNYTAEPVERQRYD